MLQFSIGLIKKDQRKDGTYPLKMEVYRSRTERVFISLKIYLTPDQWDEKKGKIVNTVTAQFDNARLNGYRLSVSKALLSIDESGEIPSMASVRMQIEKVLGQRQERPATFFAACEDYISKLPEAGTRTKYIVTLKRVRDYSPTDRSFADITAGWLRGFENHQRNKGLVTNTIAIDLRNIRAIFNRAIDDGVAQLNDYPFRRYRIRQEETRKRALSVEQLRTLRDYPCSPSQEQYRDIFMLIFYLRGINIGDLFKLRRVEPDGNVYYSRSKTRKPYAIKVEPEALAIIERYKGRGFLIAAADRYKNHGDFMRRTNRALQDIGAPLAEKTDSAKPGPAPVDRKNGTFPGLTTYWARHTVATIMSLLDIPEATISMALGHSSKNKTTGIYIAFDQRKVDAAMRMVIDFVNSDIPTERLLSLQNDKLSKPVWEESLPESK